MFVAITGIPDFQLSVNVCENVSGHVDKIAITIEETAEILSEILKENK